MCGSAVRLAQPTTMTIGTRGAVAGSGALDCAPATVAYIIAATTATIPQSGLRIASAMSHVHRRGLRRAVRRHQIVDETDGSIPVVGPERVAARHHRGAGIEHLVLQVPRTEFRADGVPRELEQLDAAHRVGDGRSLRLP